jgi:hypothetical protein
VGKLYYGPADTEVHIDDWTLAHLETVIVSKLRRAETLTFTWHIPEERGGGEETIWLQPSIPLRFRYDVPVTTRNKAWLELLMDSANHGNLRIVREPDPR